MPISLRREGEVLHEGGRRPGGGAGPAARQRHDEVVGLDGEMGQHDEGREEDRPHHGNDDAAVERPVRGAVDLRGLDDLVVDAAKAGEEHRHDEARGLPDGGDHDGVDRHLAFLDPAEGEALAAPGLHDVLEPDAGIEEPFPRDAGDDEGQRHRDRDRSAAARPRRGSSGRAGWRAPGRARCRRRCRAMPKMPRFLSEVIQFGWLNRRT